MRWHRVDEWYADSDANYRVSKAWAGGILWYHSWTPEPRAHIGQSLNFESAKTLCEYHQAAQAQAGDRASKTHFWVEKIKQEIDAP